MLLTLAGLCLPAIAQTPSEPWRTVRTDHYRVHYPAAAEPWALDAASHLDGIRERVVEEVGWAPERVVDVVVVDPYSDANGMALPLTHHPRMELWASPPDADSVIGHYRGWGELLLVHEDTHLVHLLRTARNPWERALQEVFGIGPMATKSPRWVTEGYATVVEGRLTGSGRPNGDLRAQLLRSLAQQGQLPSYGELDGSARWMGYSWAYLVGSAYLEWLEEQAGPGSLRALWSRMTARHMRSFDEAFEGVFGDPPAAMYGRYVAEVTAAAMSLEEAGPPANGTLFQEIGWTVGPPAVSPDGASVAAQTWRRKGPPSLQVWSTATDVEAVKQREEHISDLLERDPQDVAPVPPPHPPHEVLHQRRFWGRTPREPRWLADGRMLLDAWTVDGQGRWRPDLFVWDPESGRERRVTHRQDVRGADPHPDGTWAVAVQTDWGRTRLARVDLDSGATRGLTPYSVDTVVDGPRLSPDGARLAWLENSGAGWSVVVLDLDDEHRWTWVPGPGGADPRHLTWGPQGDLLYGEVGVDGFVEVQEIWRDGAGADTVVTHTAGGGLSPDVGPDGTLWYLSAAATGLDLHHAAPAEASGAAPDAGRLARRPAWGGEPSSPASEDVEARKYGVGRTGLSPLLGGAGGAGGHGQVELGVRAGDLVGRHEVLLLGSLGNPSPGGGVTGGRLGVTWRGLPLELRGHAFIASDPVFGLQRAGGVVEAGVDHRFTWGVASGRFGGLLERPLADEEIGPRDAAHAEGSLGLADARTGLWGAVVRARGQVGTTAGAGFQLAQAGGALRFGRGPSLRAGYEVGLATGASVLDRFVLGGVPSSVLPAVTTWSRIIDPAFAPATDTGRWQDEVEVAVDLPLSVYGVRHRVGDEIGASGLSAVGLKVDVSLDSQPFFHVPAGTFQAGLACRVEDPLLGWAEQPCQATSDYGFWAAVTWSR